MKPLDALEDDVDIPLTIDVGGTADPYWAAQRIETAHLSMFQPSSSHLAGCSTAVSAAGTHIGSVQSVFCMKGLFWSERNLNPQISRNEKKSRDF